MTLEEIRQKKKEYGYTNLQMAEKSGLPLATVQKVLGGTTKAPRYQTIQALASVFPEETQYSKETVSAPDRVRESGTAYAVQSHPKTRYPRQGSYTIDDYLALPDDQRVELIDGVIYDMSAMRFCGNFYCRKRAPAFLLLLRWMSGLIRTAGLWSSRMYV